MTTKTTTPDWLADIFESVEAEFASRTQYHTPAVISVSGDTQYAICVNCDSNVESWLDDEFGVFGQFGIRTEFANGATLNKVCVS